MISDHKIGIKVQGCISLLFFVQLSLSLRIKATQLSVFLEIKNPLINQSETFPMNFYCTLD